VSVYEILRGEVLRGVARPDGLGAVVYHGMLEGLALLMSITMTPATRLPPKTPLTPVTDARSDRGLVSLLANMVLQTHLEVTHVY
jgi:predicted cobalt transporter CbtA